MNKLVKAFLQVTSALFYGGYAGAFDTLADSTEQKVPQLKNELSNVSFSQLNVPTHQVLEFYAKYNSASNEEKSRIYSELLDADSPILMLFEYDITQPTGRC